MAKRERQPVGPALEQVKLTDDEQRIFERIIREALPSSDEQTKQFLEGHRSESQGQ